MNVHHKDRISLTDLRPIFSKRFLRKGVDAPLLGTRTFFPTAFNLDKTSPTPTDENRFGTYATLIPSVF